MASTTSKVLAGCGFGCLVLVLLGVATGWLGYRWVGNAIESIEEVGETEIALEKAHGGIDDFVPPPTIPAARMETFLAVREAMAPAREELIGPISVIVDASESSGGGLRVARAGMQIGTRMVGFVGARNRALLDNDMGRAEYTWIYWLSYIAWLGYPAEDSLLHEVLEDLNDDEGSVNVQLDVGNDPARMTWQLRHEVGLMMRNLERSLTKHEEFAPMAEALRAELAKFESDPGRVPWQDGLPAEFAAGLEPYRERLEANYSRATNIFELVDFD
jgi:hypothetical protein